MKKYTIPFLISLLIPAFVFSLSTVPWTKNGTVEYPTYINDIIGIGTTTPWALLTVQATSSISTQMLFDVAPSTGNSNSFFNVQSTGNVGISTSSPGSLFSIGGDGVGVNFSIASSTFSTTGGINLAKGGCFAIAGVCLTQKQGTVTSVATDSTLTGGPITTTGTLGINLGNSNTWTVNENFNYSSSTIYSSFKTSSTTLGIFGQIGIGSSSPSTSLDVNGTSYFTNTITEKSATNAQINQDRNATTNSALNVYRTAGVDEWSFGLRNDTAVSTINNIFHIRDAVNGVDGIAVIQGTSPKIGVGTSTPSAILDVVAPTSGSQAVLFNVSTTTATNAVTSIFNINANSNVGIGTSSPYAALSVVGSSGVVADHYNATSTGSFSHFFGGAAIGGAGQETYQLVSICTNNTTGIGDLGCMGDVNLGTTNNNTIGFQHGQMAAGGSTQTTAGWDFVGVSHTVGAQSTSIAFATRNAGSYGERFRINFNGMIGIATSSPWRTLSVVGTMAVNGLTSSTAGTPVCILASFEFVSPGGSTCALSSAKVKHDIISLSADESAKEIMSLNPVSFTYNETGDQRVGFIAEEVNKIDPRLVDLANKDTTLPGASGTIKKGEPISVEYANITALIVKYLQANQLNMPMTKRSVEENWQWFVMLLMFMWIVRLEIKTRK